MEEKRAKLYTTEEVAQKVGRNLGTVRNYIYRHDLGQWIGVQRFLTEADIALIRRAHPGAPRKRKLQPAPTPEPTP